MTTIDPSRVNLLEVDIEDWLWENPQKIDLGLGWFIDYWLARQFRVESGVIDLVGVCRSKYSKSVHLAVVEVKNVEIKADALTQVCRYAADIKRACDLSMILIGRDDWTIIKIIIGPGISDVTYREARALEIAVVKFSTSLYLSTNHLSWTKEYSKQIDEKDMELVSSTVISEFVELVSQSTEIFQEEAES